jgi:hypothetical protein
VECGRTFSPSRQPPVGPVGVAVVEFLRTFLPAGQAPVGSVVVECGRTLSPSRQPPVGCAVVEFLHILEFLHDDKSLASTVETGDIFGFGFLRVSVGLSSPLEAADSQRRGIVVPVVVVGTSLAFLAASARESK